MRQDEICTTLRKSSSSNFGLAPVLTIALSSDFREPTTSSKILTVILPLWPFQIEVIAKPNFSPMLHKKLLGQCIRLFFITVH